VTRGRAYALVAAVCALPRLAVLLHERDAIVTSFTEKSWDFAQTFVNTGTFGFIGGIPSANTQPLYAFFLIPIYWIFGRTWWAVGGLQIVVAVGRHSSSTRSAAGSSRSARASSRRSWRR